MSNICYRRAKYCKKASGATRVTKKRQQTIAQEQSDLNAVAITKQKEKDKRKDSNKRQIIDDVQEKNKLEIPIIKVPENFSIVSGEVILDECSAGPIYVFDEVILRSWLSTTYNYNLYFSLFRIPMEQQVQTPLMQVQLFSKNCKV